MSTDTDARDATTEPLATQEERRSHDAGFASAREVLLLGAGLALIAALSPFSGLLPAQLVLALLVLVVPGLLLLRALGQGGQPLVLLCLPASLTVHLAVGIATTQVGPLIGVERPLRQVPQLVALEAVGVLLLAITLVRTLRQSGWALSSPKVPLLPHPLLLLPLLLPVLGFVGARHLNLGVGSAASVVTLLFAVGVLAVAVWFADRLDDVTLATTLAGVSLAVLWSFSLRSEVVFGYDVVSEFRKMAITAYTGQWDIFRPDDAYGAMLSVTTLPTQLTELTGIPLLHLISVIYPAIFALGPVLVYFTCRVILPARWSFVGAAVIVVQANFGQQMPGLARQEIALVLFAAVLYVLIAGTGATRRTQYTLLTLFALAVVVTHYSTTYLAIPIAALSLLVVGVLVSLGRADRSSVAPLAALLVALIVGATLWNVVLTRSAGNIDEAFGNLGDRGFSVLGGGAGQGIVSSWLQGTTTPNLRAAEYEQAMQQYYPQERRFVSPLPNAGDPSYQLTDAPATPLSFWVVASAVATFLTRQVTLLAALVGVVVLLLRKNDGPTLRVVSGLVAGTVLVLVTLRLSSTLAISYNQERALLQALFVLAPAIGWACQWAASRRPRWTSTAVPVIATIVVSLQLAGSSSLIAFPDRGGVNLSNSSEDHRRYFSSWGEMAGARWLGDRTTREDLIYADRYGSLRYLFATGRYEGVLPDLVPTVIDRDSWIYATTTNLEGTARSQTDGKFGTYSFPQRFLDDNFDVVYSNGLSRVYHRGGR